MVLCNSLFTISDFTSWMTFLFISEMEISQKKKRKAWSVQEKLTALDLLKAGKKQAELCRQMGMSESTLRGWIKEEASLRQAVSDFDATEGLQRKRLKTASDSPLDKAVFTWFIQESAEGVPISGEIIRYQAEKLKRHLDNERGDSTVDGKEFKASKGWLARWKKRHGIRRCAVSGEIVSADTEDADEYPAKLKSIIEEGGYVPEQIYNCGETELCYRMLADHALNCKSDDLRTQGFRAAKDRLTLVLCVNKTGTHKVKPMCIGKSKSPRCFHYKNMETMGFLYRHSKNIWMTGEIFEEWFHELFVPSVRLHLKKKDLEPKALLLLDNCQNHPLEGRLVSRDGKIRVSYLPKSTSSKIQPLDQGIISAFKLRYRKNLIKRAVVDKVPIMECLRMLTISNVFDLAERAWGSISSSTIEKCWERGLHGAFESDLKEVSEDSDEDDEETLEEFTREEVEMADAVYEKLLALSNSHDLEKWIHVDDECPTYERHSDEAVAANALNQQSETDMTSCNESGNDAAPPAVAEALAAMETALNWLESQSIDRKHILHLKAIIEIAKKKKREARKQLTLESLAKKTNN